MALTKVDLTNTVTGILPVANGGTGATTQAGAAAAVLPTQTGNTGKYLTTDGTNTSWGTVTSNPGTVTSITAGTGLSGGTITSSGTIAIANTAVIAGSYTNASLTVNAQGQLTAASSGTAPVTSVTGTAPVVSSGGTTPAISMAPASSGVNGYMTGAYATKLDGIAAGAQPGTVTSVSGTGTVSGISLSGTVTSSGSLTLGGALSVTSANLPAGTVLQVVQFSTTATGTIGNTASQLPGPFQASITPSSTSNKILIMATINVGFGGNDCRYTGFWIYRNGSSIGNGDKGANNGTNVNVAGNNFSLSSGIVSSNSFTYLDSPATTSAITYAIWGQADFIGGNRYNWINRTDNLGDAMRMWTPSTMVLMEIKG